MLESLKASKAHLLETFYLTLMAQRASMYAEAVQAKVDPLENCVGFICCRNIQMSRPEGVWASKRTCHSGHKHFYCIIYQTIITPDELMLNLYGPEVDR